MQEFVTGQRWINDAELQMGLGTVLDVEHRTVTIVFQASGETRTYSRQSAPLTRVIFDKGDNIKTRDGIQITVEQVSETAGLLSYSGQDATGTRHEIDEILLDNHIQLNRPSERLFSGQIDSDKWYVLRMQTLEQMNRLGHSELRGLSGCRTTLIPHQLYIAAEVSRRYAPRVLLADEVGLGKTIEAGLIVHKQLITEQAQRVLIVVPDSLLHQWLVEMLRRFNLQFSIFDDERFQSSLEYDPDSNPFEEEQLVLCSQDFLSSDPQILPQILEAEWDLLVVDEAHHLQWSPESSSIEYQAIEKIAEVTKGLLLLTATPEQLGKTGHFARLRLLDAARFPDFDEFIEEEKHYQPIASAIDGVFSNISEDPTLLASLENFVDDKNLISAFTEADEHEDKRKNARSELIHYLLDRHGTGRVLFRNTRTTVQGFPDRHVHAYPLSMSSENSASLDADHALEHLLNPEVIFRENRDNSKVHWCEIDPRVPWLLDKLSALSPEKVLIIAARARTVLDIAEFMRSRSGLHIPVFHEDMTIIERDRAAAYFADKEEGAQALFCSEIGSEGRNFQFSHNLILFDLPLNPDLLEQRIGRLDRIGQNHAIDIHVPFIDGTAQARLFRWQHEGLDVFSRPRPAASSIFAELREPLEKALRQPENMSSLISLTQSRLQELDAALEQGRDKLLEVNSCRPEIAESLKTLAEKEDDESTIAQFMERIFDCFGVHVEEHSALRYIIRPGENMLTTFPLLQEDGMTITYDREIALSHEDIHFLSWDHPMVNHAMDIVLSSELGNTSVISLENEHIDEGTLLLECHFIFDSASGSKLHTNRYLPPTTIRTIMDDRGREFADILSDNDINLHSGKVNRQTANQIIKMKLSELKKMLDLGEKRAQSQAPELLSRAAKQASKLLNKEIQRLHSLSQVNRNVRHEEIEYFEQQRDLLMSTLDKASLRLDACRVIITT